MLSCNVGLDRLPRIVNFTLLFCKHELTILFLSCCGVSKSFHSSMALRQPLARAWAFSPLKPLRPIGASHIPYVCGRCLATQPKPPRTNEPEPLRLLSEVDTKGRPISQSKSKRRWGLVISWIQFTAGLTLIGAIFYDMVSRFVYQYTTLTRSSARMRWTPNIRTSISNPRDSSTAMP